ncbi:MAG: hypothetical protein IPG50_08085 [Myxococcales bacterium]|nr:hypothetical protein [Myxococcales bacterium]
MNSTPKSQVAIVSAKEAMAVDTDLPLLRSALDARGITHATYAWDDKAAPWDTFDLVVVRSAWDYVPRRDEFVAWARAVRAPLANDAGMLAWNTDKRYLRVLEKKGVAIVPTTWVEGGVDGGAAPTFPSTGEFVVKPAISAGARDTARYEAKQTGEATAHVRRITDAGNTAMIQPYVASVDERGETGLIFFGGRASHAIEKGAILRGKRTEVAGLFAEERIVTRSPSDAERAFAEKVLAAIPFQTPLYARVDMVEDEQGALRLLELELTEPSVFLDVDPKAAARFAEAIAERLED